MSEPTGAEVCEAERSRTADCYCILAHGHEGPHRCACGSQWARRPHPTRGGAL